MRRWAALVGVLLLAGSACTDGSDADDTRRRNEEELPIELTVKLRGDLRVTLERQTVTSRLILVESSDPELASSRVFGIETAEPVKVGDNALIVGFALLPYEGEGEYRIKPGPDPDDQKKDEPPKPESGIRVVWWKDVNGEPEQFLRRGKECKVEVEDGGDSGKLSCPDITDDTATRHFSLDVTWKVVGEPAPSTTTSGPG